MNRREFTASLAALAAAPALPLPARAQALFDAMLRGGVLHAPNIAGLARAAQPIDPTGTRHPLGDHLRRKAKALIEDTLNREERSDEAGPLVNHNGKGLGCGEPSKDTADARTDQPVQESPARG